MFSGVHAIEEELSMTTKAKKVALKTRSGKKTTNEKEGRINRQIFVKWGRGKQEANGKQCKLQGDEICDYEPGYVEDPPRQWRQKFLLMSARTTSVFPQRGRDDAAQQR